MEIPDNKVMTYWLFSDNMVDKYEYRFLSFNLAYRSKKGLEIPTMVLYGKIQGENKKELVGELNISTWSIENLKELKEQLGKNVENWNNKELYFTISKGNRGVVLNVVK